MDNFGWIIAVIAIIGGLGKLLGKSRKTESQSEKKGPQFFGFDTDQRSVGAGSSSDSNRDFESMNDELNASVAEKYETVKPYAREIDIFYEREAAKSYQRETEIPYKRDTATPYKKGRNRGSNPFRHLTKEQLREGIILAEVLSERPRAKSPHPSAARYRRKKS